MKRAFFLLPFFFVACGEEARTFTETDASIGQDVDLSDAFDLDVLPDASVDVPVVKIPVVYAHTPDTLFIMNLKTKLATKVGVFSGCKDVYDLAVDKDDHAVVTSPSGMYSLDLATAKCTLIKAGSTFPNSLSFIPEGVLGAKEVLVGYTFSDYIQFDPATGNVTAIQKAALGDYSSSGDIVSVVGGPTYLTVYKQNECNDCIVEVDPKTGKIKKNWGDIGYGSVYGVSFWGGKVYGFSDGGQIFQVAFDTAKNKATSTLLTKAQVGFWGAGSTTVAPTNED